MNKQPDQNDENINVYEPWNHLLNAPQKRFSPLVLSEMRSKFKNGKKKDKGTAKDLEKDQEKDG